MLPRSINNRWRDNFGHSGRLGLARQTYRGQRIRYRGQGRDSDSYHRRVARRDQHSQIYYRRFERDQYSASRPRNRLSIESGITTGGEQVRPKVTIICDSIGKRVSVPHVKVQSISGLYVEKALRYVRLNTNIDVKNYNIIVLHIGTVDLRFLSINQFSNFYQKLVEEIQKVNPSVLIAISGILQRPKDFRQSNIREEIDIKRKNFNQELKRICTWYRLNFLQGYKKFQYINNPAQPDRSLYNNSRFDGVHLNNRGVIVFGEYLKGAVAMMRGKWYHRNR